MTQIEGLEDAGHLMGRPEDGSVQDPEGGENSDDDTHTDTHKPATFYKLSYTENTNKVTVTVT